MHTKYTKDTLKQHNAPLSPCRIIQKVSTNGFSGQAIHGEDGVQMSVLGQFEDSRELRMLPSCFKAWWTSVDLFEGQYRVPSLYLTRSNQALRPGPPHKPLSN